MKNPFYLAILSCMVFFIASCKKDVDCLNEVLYLKYVGYDSTELLNLKVIKYKKGTNFTQVTDTVRFPPQNGFYLSYIVADYDWLIRTPTGTHKLRDINFAHGTQKKDYFAGNPISCFNAVTYYLDDSLATQAQFVNGYDSASLYITIIKQ
ncbi:MAG: hypothetical protein WCG87_03040 [Bacteroidota bacterium]